MNSKDLNVLLDELRSLDSENEWVEFKRNNLNPQEVGKRISALGNGACLSNQPFGYFVFGVEDSTHLVKGTETFFKKIMKGGEELEHWIIQRLSPKINIKVYDFYRGELKISLIRIPSAMSQPIRFMHKAYIRIGSITRDLTEFPEKEKQIWRNEPKQSFETSIAKENVSSIDLQNLLSFETYFELIGRQIPTSFNVLVEKFENEKLIKKNGVKFNITSLGAILFARDLNDFEGLFRKAIRVIVYKHQNRIETEREYTGKRGYALAFSRLLDFLEALLPKNEIIEKALRKELSVYPTIALRELIANAIIHQDFTRKGTGPMIEIFSDRIEISNPGKPLIDVLRFIDHNPESRNERLAFLMRRLNICEERGSGIDKVVDSCEVFQLPAPDFIVDNDFTRVKLFSPKTLRKMDKDDKIRATYQHCCLRYVTGDKMTNASLRKRLNIEDKNYPMASRIISETISSELIKDSDPESKSKKHTKYIPYWA